MVRLPPAPTSGPDDKPGLAALIDTYGDRMVETVTAWYTNIIEADLRAEPKAGDDGRVLRPPAAPRTRCRPPARLQRRHWHMVVMGRR